MKGWKVIREDRTSAINSIYSITYPVGEEVKPALKGSKLFFFKTEREAKDFASHWEIIVPCIAKGATKVKWVGAKFTRIPEFWENRRRSKNKQKAPSGTWFAESITCLK